MKIANADGLIKHFENVVDVKFFTPANVITIIKTFSGEVNEGDIYTFRSEDGRLISTNLTEKQRQRDIFKEKGEWLYPYADNVVNGRRVGKSTKECSVCGMQFENNLPWNAKYCPNCGSHNVGGTEP